MSSQLNSALLLDKEVMDSLQEDPNTVIPWYILSVLAKEKYDDDIVSEFLHERLARKIFNQWDDLESSSKHLIGIHPITGKVHVNDEPTWFKRAYMTLKDVQRGLQAYSE